MRLQRAGVALAVLVLGSLCLWVQYLQPIRIQSQLLGFVATSWMQWPRYEKQGGGFSGVGEEAWIYELTDDSCAELASRGCRKIGPRTYAFPHCADRRPVNLCYLAYQRQDDRYQLVLGANNKLEVAQSPPWFNP